jgi:Fe-S-cluster containining protein
MDDRPSTIYSTIAVASQTDAASTELMEQMVRALDRILALDLESFAATRSLPAACFSLWDEALTAYDAYVEHIVDAEGWEVTCRRGCAACCQHELARGVTTLEALAIYRQVHGWRDIDALYQQCATNSASFQTLLMKQMRRDARPLEPDDPRLVEAHLEYNRLERACPFLDQAEGACRIYPVRPLVCRFFFNLSPAAWCTPTHPNYLRRETRGIDAHRAVKQRMQEIDRRLGIRTLNFLAGAFVSIAADVMDGKPIGTH